jgi:hypothetical protein
MAAGTTPRRSGNNREGLDDTLPATRAARDVTGMEVALSPSADLGWPTAALIFTEDYPARVERPLRHSPSRSWPNRADEAAEITNAA